MKHSRLLRKTELRSKSRPKPWRRAESDKVTEDLANYIYARDNMTCLAPILAAAHDQPVDPCDGRLTIEHVHTEPTMGKRAKSDKWHCLLLCFHHNVDGWASMHKDWEREYLARVEMPESIW